MSKKRSTVLMHWDGESAGGSALIDTMAWVGAAGVAAETATGMAAATILEPEAGEATTLPAAAIAGESEAEASGGTVSAPAVESALAAGIVTVALAAPLEAAVEVASTVGTTMGAAAENGTVAAVPLSSLR